MWLSLLTTAVGSKCGFLVFKQFNKTWYCLLSQFAFHVWICSIQIKSFVLCLMQSCSSKSSLSPPGPSLSSLKQPMSFLILPLMSMSSNGAFVVGTTTGLVGFLPNVTRSGLLGIESAWQCVSLLKSSPSVWLLFSMLATGSSDFFCVLRLIGCFLLALLLTFVRHYSCRVHLCCFLCLESFRELNQVVMKCHSYYMWENLSCVKPYTFFVVAFGSFAVKVPLSSWLHVSCSSWFGVGGLSLKDSMGVELASSAPWSGKSLRVAPHLTSPTLSSSWSEESYMKSAQGLSSATCATGQYSYTLSYSAWSTTTFWLTGRFPGDNSKMF